jgi:hypothetical protein
MNIISTPFGWTPPLAPRPENRGRKRYHPDIQNRGSSQSARQQSQTTAIPTRGSPQPTELDPLTAPTDTTASNLPISPNTLIDPSITIPTLADPNIARNDKADPSIATNDTADPSIATHSMVDPSITTSHIINPGIATSEMDDPNTNNINPCNLNGTNIENAQIKQPLIVTKCDIPNPQPALVSQSQSNPFTPNPVQRSQYNIFHGSVPYNEYKRQKGIDGQIYVCNTATTHQQYAYNDTTTEHQHHIFPHIFSAFYNLPITHSDSTIQSFLVLNNKEDTLTQSQMLKTPDYNDFIKSQIPEIRGLEKLNVFEYNHISTLPPTAKLLSSIWSYRRKRRPNGQVLKHKSGLCVDGSQQQFGRDYWETYAPVVSWSTVRLILLLSTILGLKSRQVDYTQAFPQAELSDPVFMRMPQGWFLDLTGQLQQHQDPKFNDKEHYIKLKRNLYGCKQAARNWYHHLNQGILAQGFHQSKTDPCLYLRHDCIMILYTDDTLIFAKDDNTIDDVIKQLSLSFQLEDQGTVNDFLGIHIHTDDETKTIHMTQTGLIESIIHDVGLSATSNTKTTPSDSIPYNDTSRTPREDRWNYRSIIGKLNFLAQNTRPDISFAVHQCARFCTNPTKLHEIAVKRIARYLAYTKDKGLILHPTKSFTLDMYVDADFAGMWHHEHSALRENVLSRTGYIITYCGCPIHWVSKLQTEIALSTTESEYLALSMATRELLPLRRILLEIHQHSLISTPLNDHYNTTRTSNLSATLIYEDNAACIVLAHSDQSKMRTKHIAIKWHHFKDQIRQGHIKVVKIDSHSNWADILTKPLGRQKFDTLRKLIMGW